MKKTIPVLILVLCLSLTSSCSTGKILEAAGPVGVADSVSYGKVDEAGVSTVMLTYQVDRVVQDEPVQLIATVADEEPAAPVVSEPPAQEPPLL